MPAYPDRLRLIFTCCHPALNLEAQVALTLRMLAGLQTPQIARAFLVSETTMAQRIVRAKRKIEEARIPSQTPALESTARTARCRSPRDLCFRLQRGVQRDRRHDARATGLVPRSHPPRPPLV